MTDLLQKKYEKLLNAAARMRHYQIEYNKWHSSSDKERARVWERHIDEIIKDEVREQKSKQSNLF